MNAAAVDSQRNRIQTLSHQWYHLLLKIGQTYFRYWLKWPYLQIGRLRLQKESYTPSSLFSGQCIASRVETIRSNNNLCMYLCVAVVPGNVGGPRYDQDSYDDSDAANRARLRLAGLAARTMENNV